VITEDKISGAMADIDSALSTIWLAIKQDLLFFAKNYVYIENPDVEGSEMKFAPWPEQIRVLRSFQERRLIIVLKARQLGLTWLALIYAVWNLLCKAGFSASGLSKGENEAKELVDRIRFILRHLPPYLIQHVDDAKQSGWNGLTWEAGVLNVSIHHPGKEDSTFKAFAASAEAGRSFTVSLVVIDEWAFQTWAKKIWTAAYPTINRPTGGQVIGLSTGQRETLFEELWRKARAKENSFYPIFLPWWSDPRRDKKWYEETQKNLPHSCKQEYPSNEEEAFSAGEGAAFWEWDEKIHVPFKANWYPPAGWKIIRAYDGGPVRACCKWYAISPEGLVVCYREYYPHRTKDEDQAKEILALSKDPNGIGEKIAYTIADPAVWSPQSSGESTAEVFAKNGVNMRKGDRDRIMGWRRLHDWLGPFEDKDGQMIARLRFTRACPNTIRTYPSLLQDQNRPEDVNTRQEDHPQDCDRYFVMSRPAAPLTKEKQEEMEEERERRIKPLISKITGY
jgi:hypothetical protein